MRVYIFGGCQKVIMETQISEEDLLSGIEILPTTQPGTPTNFVFKDTSFSR